jgi:hypothetical protein
MMETLVRRCLLVALLVPLVAGCSSHDGKNAVTTSTTTATTAPTTTAGQSGTPTAAERAWVESTGEWALTFGGELNPNAIANCPASLREQAGTRPTARLAGLEDLALALCRAYRRLAGGGGGRREALATVNRLENVLDTQLYGFEFFAGPNRPLPVKGGSTEQSRVEPRLSKILTRLIGTRGEARCWSDADWKVVATHSPYGPKELGGFVDAAGKVQLNPVVCRSLAGYLYRHDDPHSQALTVAVVVFSHESEHAGGEDREDRAECWGMQRARQTALMLGMSAKDAGSLVERYWRTVYPAETPPYFSPQCRDGGALDQRRGTHVFP